jgi:plasmid stability protein
MLGQVMQFTTCRIVVDFELQCNHSSVKLQSLITIRECNVATNLVVRNVEEEVALALKQLAASHGRSAEAEHREILRMVLQRPRRRSVAEVLSSMPNVGEDADFNFRNA